MPPGDRRVEAACTLGTEPAAVNLSAEPDGDYLIERDRRQNLHAAPGLGFPACPAWPDPAVTMPLGDRPRSPRGQADKTRLAELR